MVSISEIRKKKLSFLKTYKHLKKTLKLLRFLFQRKNIQSSQKTITITYNLQINFLFKYVSGSIDE